MNYQTAATPITTEAEFDAARTAGAHIEFTACGPGSDLPVAQYSDPVQARGWVVPSGHHFPLKTGRLLRAFYPATSSEEPEA